MAEDASGAPSVLHLVAGGARPSDAADAVRRPDVVPVEVCPRVFIIQPSLVNIYVLETDDGLVMIDSGLSTDADAVFAAVRGRFDAPLHTVVYTHGHLDHAFGLRRFLDAGERPRIVAHQNVTRRFETYMRTARLNSLVNKRQWQLPFLPWAPSAPGDFIWPDVVYRDALDLRIGGERFALRHGKGETDDHTWVWVPGRRLLASGDFFCMTMPNCGNPNKVLRYPEEWADADEEMAALGAEVMLPGHGQPILGAERIRTGLLEQAEFLRSVVAQALDGLNAGLRHDQIARSIRVPEHLAHLDHLQPTYDRPEFIARNVIRRYGGWFDGYAADLLPAPGRGDRGRGRRAGGRNRSAGSPGPGAGGHEPGPGVPSRGVGVPRRPRRPGGVRLRGRGVHPAGRRRPVADVQRGVHAAGPHRRRVLRARERGRPHPARSRRPVAPGPGPCRAEPRRGRAS